MKILVTPTSFRNEANNEARKRIETFANEIVYNETGRPLQPQEILRLLDGVDGYIAGLDYIDESVIAGAPASLKVISRYGAGVDRVDISCAKKKGIVVTNTPGVNSVAVCELAFGLMLSAARNIPKLNEAVHRGKWPRVKGIELHGKTLAVIGFGAIGKSLAVRASAFGMKVVAYDPYPDTDFARRHGVALLGFEECMKSALFVSLHLPLNDQSKGLIGKKSIALMPRGGVIINTARGGIIDETAAADALKSGQLSAVCIDTFENEPFINSPLLECENVIMTPHIGAHTQETLNKMGIMAVENCIEVLEGKDCKYAL